jgi:hypothetical protein
MTIENNEFALWTFYQVKIESHNGYYAKLNSQFSAEFLIEQSDYTDEAPVDIADVNALMRYVKNRWAHYEQSNLSSVCVKPTNHFEIKVGNTTTQFVYHTEQLTRRSKPVYTLHNSTTNTVYTIE